MKRIIATFVLVLWGLGGCSENEAQKGEAQKEGTDPIEKNDAPPLFEYIPGEPGRATGVRAIVHVDGQDIATNPVEMVLLPPDEGKGAGAGASASKSATSLSKMSLERTATHSSALMRTPAVGQEVDTIGTVRGHICYMALSVSVGSFSSAEEYSGMLIYGREGMYVYRQRTKQIYIPTDFLNTGFTVGLGCVAGDRENEITSEYFTNLTSISYGYDIAMYGVEFSVFFKEGGGMVRAYQIDSGPSISFGDIFSLIVGNFHMSVDTDSTGTDSKYPRLVSLWPNYHDNTADQNALQYTSNSMEDIENENDSDYESVLAREIAQNAKPAIEEVAKSGTGRLAENVSAGSNGDFLDEFAGRTGTELIPDAPNTSMDKALYDYNQGLIEAGDNTNAIVKVAKKSQEQLSRSIPSFMGIAATLNEAEASLRLADELNAWVAPESANTKRYVDPRVVYVDIPAGEPAKFDLQTEEVAKLINRPVQDVEGATVLVNAGSDIVDQPFVLEGDKLSLSFKMTSSSLLVKMDVDLSTAKGDFPSDVSGWLIRPALRVIRIQAGPAKTAFLNVPTKFASGSPASLSVGVVDESGRLVKRPYSVSFIDAEGNEIDSVDAERGIARYQYVPEPTTPIIESVKATKLTLDGKEIPGLTIAGTGFSVDTKVSVAGVTISDERNINVKSPEQILVALPEDIGSGSIEVIVENPDGLRSVAKSVTL